MRIMKNPILWKTRVLLDLRLKNHRKDVNNPKAIPAYDNVKTHFHTCSQETKPRTKCLKSNNCFFSSLNYRLLQLGRKRRHYDVPTSI